MHAAALRQRAACGQFRHTAGYRRGVVSGTLNTTRARIDLIERRLAKLKITDKAVEKKLDDIVERFSDTTRIRNEFNHSMYVVDSRGEITHMNNMRVQEVKGRLQLGVVRPMDDARIAEMQETIVATTQLNRDIWDFLGVLQATWQSRIDVPPKCLCVSGASGAALARAALSRGTVRARVTCLFLLLTLTIPALGQIAPSAAELHAYGGLHAAAAKGDSAEIEKLVKAGATIDARDGHARTPLHVAAFMHKPDAARMLIQLGADANALEAQQYDIVTIAAVADDVPMLKAALANRGKATNVTSPYQGTALIAAAHLGHDEVVRTLIAAKAPLDHVNNLGWTALIESIVLGNGGKRHVAVLKALVEAGANVNLADRSGDTPLTLAKRRGFKEMVAILEKAGGR